MSADRILARTLVTDSCWFWLGGQCGKGYGQISVNDRLQLVHRAMYTELVGPIPDSLVLDHTCHDPEVCVGGTGCIHRLCVNPAHLAPVTNVDNLRRQSPAARSHCLRDHEYTSENTGRDANGRRYCKECRKGAGARRAKRNTSEAKAVRDWATANGYLVGQRGRLSRYLIDAYHASRRNAA